MVSYFLAGLDDCKLSLKSCHSASTFSTRCMYSRCNSKCNRWSSWGHPGSWKFYRFFFDLKTNFEHLFFPLSFGVLDSRPRNDPKNLRSPAVSPTSHGIDPRLQQSSPQLPPSKAPETCHGSGDIWMIGLYWFIKGKPNIIQIYWFILVYQAWMSGLRFVDIKGNRQAWSQSHWFLVIFPFRSNEQRERVYWHNLKMSGSMECLGCEYP